MYLDFLRFLKRRPRHMRDLLPWHGMIADGVMLTQDDAYLRSYQIHPHDLSAMTTTEQALIFQRLSRAWMRLTEGDGTWMHGRHVPVTTYPDAEWPHVVPSLIDAEQRVFFRTEGHTWHTHIYLTLWHRTPKKVKTSLRSIFYTNDSTADMRPTTTYTQRHFETHSEQFIDLLRQGCREITPMCTNEMLTLFHALISTDDHPIVAPNPPIHLSYALADRKLITGIKPRLRGPDGDVFIGVIGLRNFPHETTSLMFRQLYALTFRYDWCLRWLPLDQDTSDKYLTKTQENHIASGIKLKAMMYQVITSATSDVENIHADTQAHEAATAQHALLSGDVSFGDLTLTFVVKHPDSQILDDQLRAITRIATGAGCTVVRETDNAVEAFLGTVPGLPLPDVRRHRLTDINTLHMSPLSHPSMGHAWNTHLKAPALCRALTDEAAPYDLTFHVDDVALALMVMPMGCGKTTAINYWVTQWFKYREAQAFIFTIGGGSKVMTWCLQGEYADIGTDQVMFQVLDGLDRSNDERVWIRDWILDRLDESNEPAPKADINAYVWRAIEVLRMQEHRPRTLTSLTEVMQDLNHNIQQESAKKRTQMMPTGDPNLEDIKNMGRRIIEALRPFTRGGAYGFLDAPTDRFSLTNRLLTSNLDNLMYKPRAIPATFAIIMHRLDARITGVPTFFCFDEAWYYLEHPMILRELGPRIPGWRKQEISALFATQEPMQILKSPLATLLMQTSQTQIYGADATAIDPKMAEVYAQLGAKAIHLEMMSRAVAKRDYIVSRTDSTQLINLVLHPYTLGVCGSGSKAALARADQVMAEYGPQAFPAEWARAHGFQEEAQTIERWTNANTSMDGRPDDQYDVLALMAAAH